MASKVTKLLTIGLDRRKSDKFKLVFFLIATGTNRPSEV